MCVYIDKEVHIHLHLRLCKLSQGDVCGGVLICDCVHLLDSFDSKTSYTCTCYIYYSCSHASSGAEL